MQFRLLSLLCLAALSATVSAAPPNVVLILADDMGYSDAGCYGSEIPTPHLDGMARDGLRFTQFYNTGRCWPTRGAILTGYYAQAIRRDAVLGLRSGAQGRRPQWAALLPSLLKTAGYRSYHSGKWHVDGKPLAEGFDRSYSLDDHDRYFTPRQHTEDDRPLPPVDASSGYYASTAIADHAVKCLEAHAGEHAGRPFFSFVAFTAPHFPLQAPREDIARHRDRYLSGWDALRGERWARMKAAGIGGASLSAFEREQGPPYAFPEALAKLGRDEVNRPLEWTGLTGSQRAFQAAKMAVHAAMVDRMDREIGRILGQLEKMGAAENTLVMFLSDNGASAEMMVRGDGHDPDAMCGTGATFLSLGPGWSTMANTPFRKHKTWVHEGGIATSCIVRWPAAVKDRGALRHVPAHVVDFVPTVLAAAGVAAPGKAGDLTVPARHGVDLGPVLRGDGGLKRQHLWWQHEGNRAVRSGDWKLVAAGREAPWELYDLADDRAESKNLAGERPDKVKELEALWERLQGDHAALARTDLKPEDEKPAARPRRGD